MLQLPAPPVHEHLLLQGSLKQETEQNRSQCVDLH